MKTLRHGGQAHGATVAGRGHHVWVPALDTDTGPVDRFRSAEHGNVVPDVPPTPRRQSAEGVVREKHLVKGTFPHITPVILRRPLTRPLQRPFRRRLRPARPAQSGRHHVRANVDTTRTLSQSHRPTPSPTRTEIGTSFSGARAAGDRRIGRQSPPPAPSKSLTPFTYCWVHCP